MQVSPDYRQTAARCAFFVGLQGGSGELSALCGDAHYPGSAWPNIIDFF